MSDYPPVACVADAALLFPPALRGRVGEVGMPLNKVSHRQRNRARRLRRAMTPAEQPLWRRLKAHRLEGPGFRRQAPVGPHIADFISHACRLVVEVDGASHDFASRLARDGERDRWFASRGCLVLRVTSDDVRKNLEGVVPMIGEAARRGMPAVRLSPHTPALPRKGGGRLSHGGAD